MFDRCADNIVGFSGAPPGLQSFDREAFHMMSRSTRVLLIMHLKFLFEVIVLYSNTLMGDTSVSTRIDALLVNSLLQQLQLS